MLMKEALFPEKMHIARNLATFHIFCDSMQSIWHHFPLIPQIEDVLLLWPHHPFPLIL